MWSRWSTSNFYKTILFVRQYLKSFWYNKPFNTNFTCWCNRKSCCRDCLYVKNNFFLTVETSWSSDCNQLSCMKECDHGFKSDRFGCPLCECLTEPKPDCSERKQCRRVCDFGFTKDQYGCDVCACLPPPCQVQPLYFLLRRVNSSFWK